MLDCVAETLVLCYLVGVVVCVTVLCLMLLVFWWMFMALAVVDCLVLWYCIWLLLF